MTIHRLALAVISRSRCAEPGTRGAREMKRAVSLLALLAFPSASLARDFLGVTPDSCYRLAWKPKIELSQVSECKTGYSLRSVGFKHKPGENGTHQESIEVLCCQDKLTDPCRWSPFTSNMSLSTNIAVPARSVVTGIAFRHQAHENGTHQQSYAIKSCTLAADTDWATVTAPVDSKLWPETEFGCGFVSQYVIPSGVGFTRVPRRIVGVGFSHASGHNGTHEELVHMTCLAH
jgi:hypothetical protein